MNVGVGGTNGWFPEAQGDKPWLDASQSTYISYFLPYHAHEYIYFRCHAGLCPGQS